MLQSHFEALDILIIASLALGRWDLTVAKADGIFEFVLENLGSLTSQMGKKPVLVCESENF